MKSYYDSCRVLPLFNFFEILETNNLNWLITDYNGGEIKEDNNLPDVWEKIFEEYIILKNDESIKDHYRIIAEVNELEYKLKVLNNLTYFFGIVDTKDVLKEVMKSLSTIGYPVDESKPKEEEYEKLVIAKKGLLTNIRRKKALHKDVFEKEKKKIKRNYEKEVGDVEYILNKNFIDTKTVTVSRWLVYLDQVSQKIKAKSKNGKG